jgi:hypothetical protein
MGDEPIIEQLETRNEGNTPAFGYHPAWGFIGVLIGIAAIGLSSLYEASTLRDAPGLDIVYSEEGETLLEGALELGVRRVPLGEFPAIEQFLASLRDRAAPSQVEDIETNIRILGVEQTESILCVDLQPEVLESLLESGRIPEPGEREVFAGVYTRLDSFHLDGEVYTVVGRLKPSTAGLYFSYLLPRTDASRQTFFEHDEATVGWFDFDGRAQLVDQVLSASEIKELNLAPWKSVTNTTVTVGTVLGLILVALFGAMAHLSVFRIAYQGRCGPLRPAIRAYLEHPSQVIWMHVLLYGIFFGMMYVSFHNPVPQLWLTNLVTAAFEEGELSYVQEAYQSGNVVAAAFATFKNNFLIQTVVLTMAISLVLPLIGILKTALSFTLVGFSMVPTWVGMSGLYSFHSITMTLELEAYIFACVCVFFFWKNIVSSVFKRDLENGILRSVAVLASGTLLSGIMLFLAALYEAITLILAAR